MTKIIIIIIIIISIQICAIDHVTKIIINVVTYKLNYNNDKNNNNSRNLLPPKCLRVPMSSVIAAR